MNFQDYAARIRSQAVAAASRIPTFDDMAAKDEYIHSEDFNVTGEKKKAKKEETSVRHQPAVEPDETSSTGSWSLLDRPSQLRSPAPTSQQQHSNLGDFSHKLVSSEALGAYPRREGINQDSSVPFQSDRGVGNVRPSGSLPLLSVVADALSEKDETHTKSSSKSNETLETDSNALYSDGSDDDSIESDADEEDPILSLVLESKSQGKARRNVSKPKASTSERNPVEGGAHAKQASKSSRILDDLDQRLATAGSQLEPGIRRKQHMVAACDSAESASPFGKWVKNLASSTPINHLLRRADATPPSSATKAPPPLARQKQEQKIYKKPEEDFQVAVSSSLLADDELAQLAMLKQSSSQSYCSNLLKSIQEHRHFLFILFTMILAALVYFFSRSMVAEDVT